MKAAEAWRCHTLAQRVVSSFPEPQRRFLRIEQPSVQRTGRGPTGEERTGGRSWAIGAVLRENLRGAFLAELPLRGAADAGA